MNSKKKIVVRTVIAMALAGAVAVPLIAQVAAPSGAPAPVAAPAASKVAPEAVVLTVGDEKITAKEFDDFVSDLPQQYQMMAQGPGKRMVAEELVKVKLMSHEAAKRGMEKSEKYKRQMVLMRDQLLAGEIAADVQKGVDDAALKKYYDEHKADFEQVKARHILIRTGVPTTAGAKAMTDEEAKAKIDAIRKRLVDGKEDFAKVAKAESDDKRSGEEGGSLGTFGHGQMVPQFETAAFSQKVGEISEPIKTQFGYHLIQVEEKKTQPFEEVKDELMQKMGPEKVEALVKDLRKDSKVELNEAYFGPPAPAGAGLPPGAGGPPQQ